MVSAGSDVANARMSKVVMPKCRLSYCQIQARRNPRSRQSGMLTRRARGPLHHGEALQREDNAPMIWHLPPSANRSRPALHQPSTAAARKASSASPMMTPRAQMRTASKEMIMAMQMDETELEDMRDDALALAKGGARSIGSRSSGGGDRRPARRGRPRGLGL